MRTLNPAVIAFAILMSWCSTALAQTGGTASSLGGVVTNVGNSFGPAVMFLLTGGCLLVGVFFVGSGLVRMIDISGGREGTGKDAMFRLVGGGLLTAMPYVAFSAAATLFGDSPSSFSPNGVVEGATEACLTPAGGTPPMICVARNVANNLARPAISVVVGLAYVTGLWLIASALHKVAISQGQGGHQEGKGWVPRLVFGAVLTQLAPFISAIAGTLGYGAGVMGGQGLQPVAAPSLSWTGASSATISEFTELFANLSIICVMFGALAVWRGISKLRGHAEGTERDGIGGGMTHIVGGVMLANAQTTICLVARTFFGVGFCN